MKFIIALSLLVAAAVAADIPISPLHAFPPVLPTQQEEASERITNGNIASEKQFPYQAALILYLPEGTAFCGGSLISNQWVVTAAHCTDLLDPKKGVDVKLGAWNQRDSTEKEQQTIFVQTKNVHIHAGWDPAALTNDISLIKLPNTITFTEFIQPVKLPKISNQYATYAGDNAYASGWGKIDDQATSVTDVLRFIEVPIMNNSGCSPWYLGVIDESKVCIKTTGGYSTCNGDSGGPLVTAHEKVEDRTLIGVTSFGIALGCARGWPGVFTRVTYYADWIKEISGVYAV